MAQEAPSRGDSKPQGYIGKIMITENQPVTPLEFYAWVKEDVPLSSFLIAEDTGGGDKVLAFVENSQAISTFKDAFNEYFSHEMGEPGANPSTIPTTVRVIKCKVVVTSRPLVPITSRLLIRRPIKSDLESLFYANIPKDRRIMGGLFKICNEDEKHECWAPFYYDSEYVLGQQAAHVNISGITGLATKTSYAIFLAQSTLRWAIDNNYKIAIVMFNVKGDDLLELFQVPIDLDELESRIQEWDPRLAPVNLALWEALREEGTDFTSLLLNNNVKINIFTYDTDPYHDKILRMKEDAKQRAIQRGNKTYVDFLDKNVNITLYSFEFRDLGPLDQIGQRAIDRDEFLSIFEKEELSDVMVDAIDMFLAGQQQQQLTAMTFEGVINSFRSDRSSRIDPRTAAAISRRISGFVARATHIIPRNGEGSKPIDVARGESPGISAGINVIQLYNLTDVEKRLVVTHVLNGIRHALERWPTKPFEKVLIFVDELNLYAPRGGSAVSGLIKDIAARGRFMSLSLVGAEQFASLIDEEVYGNSSTKVMGRQSSVEVSKEIYRGLGDLRDYAAVLDKGQMIVDTPVIPTPIIIRYPVPVHELFRGKVHDR
jgi:DNA helicase HerA-like ATPase